MQLPDPESSRTGPERRDVSGPLMRDYYEQSSRDRAAAYREPPARPLYPSVAAVKAVLYLLVFVACVLLFAHQYMKP